MSTPNASRYAVTSWGGNPYTELTVPSGQLCLVRKLQPMDLAAGDLLGKTDLLSDLVQERITSAKAGPQDHKKPKAEQKLEDEKKIVDVLSKALSSSDGLDSMIDSIVVKAVVEPRVEFPPKDFADRREDGVYVDAIAFNDKMYIFDWVMKGIDDLKSFREPATESVEAVEPVKGVPYSAE